MSAASHLIQEAQTSHAQRLDLGGCGLTELPHTLFKLTSLTHLSLRHNQLATLPTAISQLTALQQLSLADNALRELPPEIGQLTQLTHLNLKNNQLTALPYELLSLENLAMLRLGGNALPLPTEILAKWNHPQRILDYYRENCVALATDTAEIAPSPTALHWLIAEQFTPTNLEQLCQELAIDYHTLAGQTHNEKAHAFVTFHEARGLMAEFAFLLRHLRPEVFS